LTVIDHPRVANRLALQPNLPNFIKVELPSMYGY
jgi:hypothetical protein